ncbi:MAG: glutamate--tRNA ligase, partial [Acidimicrobiales bacterium]
LFAPKFAIEDESFEKAISRDPDAGSILEEARERLESCVFEAAPLKAEISELGDRRGRKLGKVQAPIRAAVLGRGIGLPLFESLEVLGRARSLERLDTAIVRLAASRREFPSA